MTQTTGRPQVRLPGAADGGSSGPTADLFQCGEFTVNLAGRPIPTSRSRTHEGGRPVSRDAAGYYSS